MQCLRAWLYVLALTCLVLRSSAAKAQALQSQFRSHLGAHARARHKLRLALQRLGIPEQDISDDDLVKAVLDGKVPQEEIQALLKDKDDKGREAVLVPPSVPDGYSPAPAAAVAVGPSASPAAAPGPAPSAAPAASPMAAPAAAPAASPMAAESSVLPALESRLTFTVPLADGISRNDLQATVQDPVFKQVCAKTLAASLSVPVESVIVLSSKVHGASALIQLSDTTSRRRGKKEKAAAYIPQAVVDMAFQVKDAASGGETASLKEKIMDLDEDSSERKAFEEGLGPNLAAAAGSSSELKTLAKTAKAIEKTRVSVKNVEAPHAPDERKEKNPGRLTPTPTEPPLPTTFWGWLLYYLSGEWWKTPVYHVPATHEDIDKMNDRSLFAPAPARTGETQDTTFDPPLEKPEKVEDRTFEAVPDDSLLHEGTSKVHKLWWWSWPFPSSDVSAMNATTPDEEVGEIDGIRIEALAGNIPLGRA
mmetsp:Transcript_89962/g.160117  ORF Transcript_89962/g.160117 Transcript_89962/m.160117 type:complete len:478 (+) Transcript_89962:40-1473(+)